MKIQLMSDLHLEFYPIEITNTDNADILVLSGDILVADRFTRGEASPYFLQAQKWREWFAKTCAQYKRVYYVLGNHEHYHGRFVETADILRKNLDIANLHILDNEIAIYDGFTIVGTTLWGNFDRNPVLASTAEASMNDYHLIQRPGYQKLRAADTVAYFDKAIATIREACSYDRPVLVFSHHGPSYNSVEEKYKGNLLNAAYFSELDGFIQEHPQIHLWTHGHTHSSHKYRIGSTLIACNPRGYANKSGQENPQFVPDYYINI